MSAGTFWLIALLVGAAFVVLSRLFLTNEYFYFAVYVVLEYIVLSTAWNILGGYTGYTNFGTGAFFAFGAYSSVVLHKLSSVPIPVMIPVVVPVVIGLLHAFAVATDPMSLGRHDGGSERTRRNAEPHQ